MSESLNFAMNNIPDYEEYDNSSASSSHIALANPFLVAPSLSRSSIENTPLRENTTLSFPSISPSSPPISPFPPDHPPEYAQVQKPTENVCYSFSPMGNNAMVLIPPADAQDTRPQYYITVSMNCFMPLSHTTTIYRGANEYGFSVAEFEMGIIDAENRVRIGERMQSISSYLVKNGSHINAIWKWTLPCRQDQEVPMRLIWDCTRHPCFVCTLYPSKTRILARFTSHIGITHQRLRSQLEVTPEGHDFFDHILISILIIERKRLTPGRDAMLKTLFN